MRELQDAIAGIVANFEKVSDNLRAAETALAKTKEENAKWDAALVQKKQDHGRLMSELEAKRVAADIAAEEAAARIKLNNEQMAELLKVRDDLKKRQVMVEQREATVVKVSKVMADAENALTARENDIATVEKDLARRKAKLQEALG